MVKAPLEEAFQSSWPDRGAGPTPMRRRRFHVFRELPFLIAVALTMALLIKTFLIQAFYIPSESMVPTLLVKDRVLVNKLAYRFRDPRRGEIVVFLTGTLQKERRSFIQKVVKNVTESLGISAPGDVDFIKRVIGLPGETIEIKNNPATGHNAVYITPPNGGKAHALTEPYINKIEQLEAFAPFKIPKGRYFLMGDNRGDSSDSRINSFQGICNHPPPCAVPKSRLIGKAFVRIFPPKRMKVFSVPIYAMVGLCGAVPLRRRRKAA